MKHFAQRLNLILLALTGIFLIGLQIKPLGLFLLIAGISELVLCQKAFRKDILLIYLSLILLGITPINTSIEPTHMMIMGLFLIGALLLPYYISHFIVKSKRIQYKLHNGKPWTSMQYLYLWLTAFVAYASFPFALRVTDSYLNWSVPPGYENIILLFIGTNALGIWDELFFINTVLGILRHHMSFAKANVLQAVLFTSFLYELGFRGWMFLVIFGFALLQGYIFKKTESLLYVIAIHLAADLLLFLTLIYLHHPTWLPNLFFFH